MEDLNIIFQDGHLSIIEQNIQSIPPELGQTYGDKTFQLYIIENKIKNVSHLENFKNLKSLTLDNNCIVSDGNEFPLIESLETLFVNSNEINQLEIFLDCIENQFPNLIYLSMLKNPCCPNYFVGKGSSEYQKYRHTVLSRFPKLLFLDATPVTEEERQSGLQYRNTVARPDPSQYQKKVDVIIPIEKALPVTDNFGQHTTKVGKVKVTYRGDESEGNRFILNEAI